MTQPPKPDPMLTRHSLLLRLKPDAPAAEVAWNVFYERYAPIIGGFARKLSARPQDVADIVQDVLTGFFAASPKFVYDPEKGRFRGYLKTCTFRAIRKRMTPNLRFAGLPVEEIDPADARLEETWNDLWETEKLRHALDVVRDRYAVRPDSVKTFRAFELYVLLERPAEEVAAELKMSVESVHTAKSRISRALKVAVRELDESHG